MQYILRVVCLITALLLASYANAFENQDICMSYRNYNRINESNSDYNRTVNEIQNYINSHNNERKFSGIATVFDFKQAISGQHNRKKFVVYVDNMESYISSILNIAANMVFLEEAMNQYYEYIHINAKKYYRNDNLINLMKYLKINAPPAIIWLDEKGREIMRITDCISPVQLSEINEEIKGR